MKKIGNAHVYEVEWRECEKPLDPYYQCKPYAPFVPMQGPFCKRCGKFIEIDLPDFEYIKLEGSVDDCEKEKEEEIQD